MPPSPPPAPSLPLPQAHTLLTAITDFLTVAIHTLLYHRRLYPPETFLAARAYNLAVRQNRHPRVVAWVRGAVDAVAAQLAAAAARHVVVVVHAPARLDPRLPPAFSPDDSNQPHDDDDTTNHDDTDPASSAAAPAAAPPLQPGAVLERWLFDVSRVPAWPGGAEAMGRFGRALRKTRDDEADAEAARPDVVNWADVDEQLRGLLRRLVHVAERLGPLPDGCTFTVAVELRDEADAPIGVRDFLLAFFFASRTLLRDDAADGGGSGWLRRKRIPCTDDGRQHPQPWIPSQPNLQPASDRRPTSGRDVGGAGTTSIRSMEAGPLFLECWVEEGKAKEAWAATQQSDLASQ